MRTKYIKRLDANLLITNHAVILSDKKTGFESYQIWSNNKKWDDLPMFFKLQIIRTVYKRFKKIKS
jgi:hypothetical protein